MGRGGRSSPTNGRGKREVRLADNEKSEKPSGMWGNNTGISKGMIPGRRFLGPLFLIVVPPIFVMLVWYTNFHLDGSFTKLWSSFSTLGFKETLRRACLSPVNPVAWKIIGTYMAVQLLLMRLVPGKTFHGPVTPTGNVPVYNGNGVQCFLLSIALFLSGAFYFKLYNGGVVYDYSGYLLSSMNLFALVFCGFLYLKGRFLPSSSDSGHTGNLIFDYYWGTELYPRIFGWDVKMFTNCRFGMVFWAISAISYACAQYERYGYVSDSMLVNVALQLIYVFKFFVWETGYLASIDIMHDRAGYYICWGCLVFLPTIYTSHSFFLTTHPVNLGPVLAGTIFALGVLSIWINYDCDRQRQAFRAAKGKCNVWGKPAEYITATYKTEKGTNTSLLLLSGWWGLARHFHYVPEIMASFFWSVPALFDYFMPYFYVLYLMLLLTDRAFRDDARCKSKYGVHWDKYCERVPSRILPGIL